MPPPYWDPEKKNYVYQNICNFFKNGLDSYGLVNVNAFFYTGYF